MSDFRTLVREAIATLDASGFPGGFTTENNPTFDAAVERIVAAAGVDDTRRCAVCDVVMEADDRSIASDEDICTACGPNDGDEVEVECDDCDGCGWVEGGRTIKTECSTCKGEGVVRRVWRSGTTGATLV